MNKYEIMFIVKTTLEGESVKKLTDDLLKIITSSKSKVIEFKELGQKKLAYPVKKELNGYYFLLNVEADSKTVDEFKRKVSINENVLRHLIIKLDEE